MNVSYHYLTEFYEFAVLEAKTVGYWQLHMILPVYCYWFNFETRTNSTIPLSVSCDHKVSLKKKLLFQLLIL